MALNKRDMVRHVARYTDLTQGQAREALDRLIELWMEELARGGSIAVDDFLILKVVRIERQPGRAGQVRSPDGRLVDAPPVQYRLSARPGRQLRERIREKEA